MSLKSSISNAFYDMTGALAGAFNFCSGNSALYKRGLDRGSNNAWLSSAWGVCSASLAVAATSVRTMPLGPIAVLPTAAALVAGGLAPAVMNAGYIIHKDKQRIKTPDL